MLCLGQSLSDVLPIGHLINGLDIVRSDILVLEIVGVFPDVNAEEGNQSSGGFQGILVGAGGDAESLRHLVITQPAPARALIIEISCFKSVKVVNKYKLCLIYN